MTARINIITKIQNKLSLLRPAERAVGELVLSDPYFVCNSSISEIAMKAGISEPSVTRFAQSLGYKGVREFKLSLTKYVVSDKNYVPSVLLPQDNILSLSHKVFESARNALEVGNQQIDHHMLEKAIEAMAKAKRIDFYGIGTSSSIVAYDAHLRFYRFPMPSNFHGDIHLQRFSAAAHAGPGTVIVAISQLGETRGVIENVKVAQEQGATVIVITKVGSTLAKLGDIVLATDVQEDVSVYTPATSRLVHLTIVDTLFVGVAFALGPQMIEKLKVIKQAVKDQIKEDNENYHE